MQSRAIAILTMFALVCLIGLGGAALYISTADAATQDPASDVATVFDAPDEPNAPVEASVGEAPPPAAPAVPTTSDPAYVPLADSLQQMLTQVHVRFEPYHVDVNNEMIPHIADVITLVNEHDDLAYRFELSEPDVSLARRRAQALSDVLRLNVLRPALLTITGSMGPLGTRVIVTSPQPSHQ